MSRIRVEGKTSLAGEVCIQGSKNAVLPVMAASLLHKGCTILHHCPRISDVFAMEHILQTLGVRTNWEGHTLSLDCRHIQTCSVTACEAAKMRASILLAGSLLGREGYVQMGYPGGCVIGRRPIDLHLEVFARMGVQREEESGLLSLQVKRLKGIRHRFARISVGATENALLAAVRAEGTTILENAAREPEISTLCDFLCKMGAQIYSDGRGKICIRGGCTLRDTEYTVPPDRIVAGTFLMAGAATRGKVTLLQAPAEQLDSLLSLYQKMGGQYLVSGGTLRTDSRGVQWALPLTETGVYPGFPTDLQPLLLAVCCTLRGRSIVRETIFEDRFRVVEQLRRMGADIWAKEGKAQICGPSLLRGCSVEAPDLRAGAALVVAALCAEGTTVIESCEYIERGYEDLYRDINLLGGRIRKEKDCTDETEHTGLSGKNQTEHAKVSEKNQTEHAKVSG